MDESGEVDPDLSRLIHKKRDVHGREVTKAKELKGTTIFGSTPKGFIKKVIKHTTGGQLYQAGKKAYDYLTKK